jgi:hypothetical protein
VAGYKRSWQDGKMKEVPVWGDVNPAWIEHLAISYFGGMGTFFNDVYKTSSQVLEGANTFMENKDAMEAVKTVNLTNIPMVQRFIIRPYRDDERENWYLEKEVVEKYDRLHNRYRKVEEWGKWEEMMNEYDYSRSILFNIYDDVINKINEDMKATKDRDEITRLRKERNNYIREYTKELDEIYNKLGK